MLANMCVEAHLRELLERGFEVAVPAEAVDRMTETSMSPEPPATAVEMA